MLLWACLRCVPGWIARSGKVREGRGDVVGTGAGGLFCSCGWKASLGKGRENQGPVANPGFLDLGMRVWL